jgi:TPR repeat protein
MKGRVLAGAALFAGLGWLSGWGQPAIDLEKVRARAEQADVEAQNTLGTAYNEGQGGLKQDHAEALKWFRRAADKGFAPAQYNLGLAYELGHGVPADEREAFKSYLMAAEQGFGAAQFNVGNMYAAGRGVGQDLFEANLWFKQAAEKGIVEAQFNLGLAYEAGRGVRKDEAQAVRWYKQAADRGFPRAQYNLGLLLGMVAVCRRTRPRPPVITGLPPSRASRPPRTITASCFRRVAAASPRIRCRPGCGSAWRWKTVRAPPRAILWPGT